MATVIDVSATSDPRWAEVVERHRSDVFHSPAWLGVIERTYGFDLRALIVDEHGTATAGIPYAVIEDLRGTRVACAPFSDFCDPLVASRDEWTSLSSGLASLGDDVRLRTLHADIPDDDPVFEEQSRARWHAIDLLSDLDDTWMSISSSARRAIRKAQGENVVIRQGSTRDDVRSFFELHLRNRKTKHRLLAQPFAFFEHIWDEFLEPGRGSLLLASHDGADIAGVLFLDWHRTRYYKFNASDPDAAVVRPNDLILWTAIERATADGIDRIDFGLSDWDQEGLIRYKKKYATSDGIIVFRRSRSAPDPIVSANEALSTVTHLLTGDSIPDEVTEAAGASLYQYFA
jgi:CelD/BcsL family acetyltransferase involved in cellulose biosynthesis